MVNHIFFLNKFVFLLSNIFTIEFNKNFVKGFRHPVYLILALSTHLHRGNLAQCGCFYVIKALLSDAGFYHVL